jgi:hypothetical protein
MTFPSFDNKAQPALRGTIIVCNCIGWGLSSRKWSYKNPHATAAISKMPINTFSTPFGTRTNLTRGTFLLHGSIETLRNKAGKDAANS